MNKKTYPLAVISLLLFFAAGSMAATFTVTKLADTNDGVCNADCSLREAVAAANTDGEASTVHFASAINYQTLIVNSELVTSSTDALTIEGTIWLGAPGGSNRIFYINNPAFTLNGLTIFYGGAGGANSGYGGAIASFGGAAITIDRIQFFSNFASIEGGLGYFAGGTLNISNSNLNYSSSPKCGALSLTGTAATIKNSSVRGDGSQSSDVGGICLKAGSSLSMTNATVTGNGSAGGGGGVYIENSTLVLGNTVIAGSRSRTGLYQDIWFAGGTVTSLGNNHIGAASGDAANTGLPIAWTGADTLDVPPMLSGDDPHGGGMSTTLPLAGSPLINSGSNAIAAAAGLTTDQRGFPRVVGGTVDKGANEFGASLPPTAAPLSIAGRVTDAGGRGIAGVSVTISGQQGNPRTAITNPFGYYRFDDVAGGASYTVSASAKRYRFEPRVFTAGDDLLDIDFIAQ